MFNSARWSSSFTPSSVPGVVGVGTLEGIDGTAAGDMSDDINRYIVHGVNGEGQPAFLYI